MKKSFLSRIMVVAAVIALNVPLKSNAGCLVGGSSQNTQKWHQTETSCYCYLTISGTDCYDWEPDEISFE